MKKRSIKLEINLTNKWFYTFVFFGAILLLAIGVFAYNSGKAPSVFGHSAEELDGVCKTNGEGCPTFEKGISSCRIKQIYKDKNKVCCDAGEFLTGINNPEPEYRAQFSFSGGVFCATTTGFDGAYPFQIICCK